MANQFNEGMLDSSNDILDDIPDLEETTEFLKDVTVNFINAWSNTVATGQYPMIAGDSTGNFLIQMEESADEDIIRIDCAGAEQVTFQDGSIEPTTDNDIDLGGSSNEFKDLYIDGAATIDLIGAGSAFRTSGSSYSFLTPSNNPGASVFMLGDSNTIAWFYLNVAPTGWKVLATGADRIVVIGGGGGGYTGNGGTEAGAWAISGLSRAAHTHGMQNNSYNGSDASRHGENTAVTGAQSSSSVSVGSAWRPSASIGKLFQLDTA